MVYIERINAIDPLLSEAMAVSTAMEQAARMRWKPVTFECDSLLLCNEVNTVPTNPIWSTAEIVSSIKDQLRGNPEWQVRRLPRTANRMAHLLAKWAFSSNLEGSVPLDRIPDCIKFCDL